LVVESGETPDAIESAVTAALSAPGGVLTLSDERGRRVVVPIDRLAYVEIGETESRRVGFGTL
jgi:3-hydroxyacyl-CoA dehydrogenase